MRSEKSGQIRERGLHRVNQVFDVADGFIHQLLFVGVEVDLNDLLHATGAQDTWHTDEASADAILVIAPCRTGQDALLVFHDGFDHLNGSAGRSVVRTGAHQFHNFTATDLGPFHTGVDGLFGQQLGHRNAVHAGVAGQGDHVVAMATEQQSLDVFDRASQFHRNKAAEAGHVQATGLAQDAAGWESRGFPCGVHHGIEGI
jgi:hypothetical protein